MLLQLLLKTAVAQTAEVAAATDQQATAAALQHLQLKAAR
jgi:hypothetical protein